MDYSTYLKNIEDRNKRLISNLSKTTESKVVSFDDYELLVNPGVFDPSLGEGSQIMAKIKYLFVGENVLEIGTGSGALSILAAENVEKVLATDISQDAIECAKENILKYNLTNIIELRKGNLFDAIKKYEKFEIILFNPPFLNGVPNSNLEHSYYDQDYKTLERFFFEASNYLKPNGVIYLCFGSVGDVGYLNYLIKVNKFLFQNIYSTVLNDLQFFIYKINCEHA